SDCHPSHNRPPVSSLRWVGALTWEGGTGGVCAVEGSACANVAAGMWSILDLGYRRNARWPFTIREGACGSYEQCVSARLDCWSRRAAVQQVTAAARTRRTIRRRATSRTTSHPTTAAGRRRRIARG